MNDIQSLRNYLFRFKEFVDRLYNEYRNTPYKIYISNIDERIKTIDDLITWITDIR